VKRIRYGRIAAIVTAGALALTACGNDPASDSANSGSGDNGGESSLSGSLAGSGATSQESAQNAWAAKFMEQNPDVDLSYDPVGSGGGRTAFLEGGTIAFAGSDSALDDEERAKAKTRCAGGDAYNLPLYISPIAVIFNLKDVKELKLSPATVAKIFDGKITKWNDQAIASLNDGVDLPSTAISPVHRSDDSGTTDNFTQYLSAAAQGGWKYDADGVWPIKGGEAAEGTSGMVAAVKGGEGTIGYADESQAGGLGLVSVQVGSDFVAPSAEGAAKAVAVSKPVAGRDSVDMALDIDRTTTEAGAYPVLLASYLIACQHYDDENEAALVKGFLSYIVSDAGQQAAAAQAGSAPLDSELASKAADIVGKISAN